MYKNKSMKLVALKQRYAVCALEKPYLPDGEFVSLTISGGEVSLVCEEDKMPEKCIAETGWRALRVQGPLDFSLIGILAALAGTLAGAGVSVFALSTYETDYLLVKQQSLDTAVQALRQHGHDVII